MGGSGPEADLSGCGDRGRAVGGAVGGAVEGYGSEAGLSGSSGGGGIVDVLGTACRAGNFRCEIPRPRLRRDASGCGS